MPILLPSELYGPAYNKKKPSRPVLEFEGVHGYMQFHAFDKNGQDLAQLYKSTPSNDYRDISSNFRDYAEIMENYAKDPEVALITITFT